MYFIYTILDISFITIYFLLLQQKLGQVNLTDGYSFVEQVEINSQQYKQHFNFTEE